MKSDATNALTVHHDNGLVVRYGTISNAAQGLKKGDRVTQGQLIAYVRKLNSGSSMLHFEVYAGTQTGALSTPGNVFIRRGDLVDPTGYLDLAVVPGSSWRSARHSRNESRKISLNQIDNVNE